MPSLKPTQLAFFSYAHEDAEFALRLAKDLRAGAAAVWMDRLDIKPGQRWDRAIEDALAKCPQLLVILSPAAIESTNVMDEVSLALEEGKTVLPVIHRECKIPFRLRRLQYVDVTQNYDEGVVRLLETLRFTTPSSEAPKEVLHQEIGGSSDHDGGAKEVNLLSQPAPQKQEATLPTPKRAVFRPATTIVWGVAILLIALTGLLLVLNQTGIFKQAEKKPTSPVNAEEPVSTVTPAKPLKSAKSTKAATAAPSPTMTLAQERSREDESAVAYNKSGKMKIQRSDFDGAIGDLDRAIELDPKSVTAYNDRAFAKESKGDFTGALADYSRAIEIDPNYPNVFSQRGFVYYLIREFKAAIDDFHRSIEINPKGGDHRHLFLWLAQMHLGQKKRADRELSGYFGDRIKAPGDRAGRIGAFLLDQLTLAEFLPPKGRPDTNSVVPRFEQFFFAGMKCLFTGDKERAVNYLRHSLENGSSGPPARAAPAELKALGEQ